jgi:hypothetical protein
MRQKTARINKSEELVAATGLVWGHLNAGQYEDAYRLARGCLRLWPEDRSLALMMEYASAEVLEPVDVRKLEALRDPATEDWVALVLRRAQTGGEESDK